MEAILGIAAIIAGFLGIYYGYRLSESAAKRRELDDEHRQNAAFRKLLSYEIDENLNVLRSLAESISKGENSVRARGEEKDMPKYFAMFLTTTPEPPFNSIVWTTQMHFAVSALEDQTLSRVFHFYTGLDYLRKLRNAMISIKSESMIIRQSDVLTSWKVPDFRNEEVESFVVEFKNMLNHLLSESNPFSITKMTVETGDRTVAQHGVP